MSRAVTSCDREFQGRMQYGYNLTAIFQFFRSERAMSTVCGYVDILDLDVDSLAWRSG